MAFRAIPMPMVVAVIPGMMTPMNFHVFCRRVKPPVMARSECVWIQNFFAIRLMSFQIIPQNLRNRDGKIWIL